jgi:rubrerythrin
MYLREALSRCRDLEEEVSRIYDELASQHTRTPELARAWKQLAQDERSHSRQLGVLLAVHEALDDDGPFLVGLERRSRDCAREIRETYTRVHAGIAPRQAVELCLELEKSELDHLFIELRDLSRPAVKRLSERLYKRTSSHSDHRERIEALRQIAVADQDAATGAGVEHPS